MSVSICFLHYTYYAPCMQVSLAQSSNFELKLRPAEPPKLMEGLYFSFMNQRAFFRKKWHLISNLYPSASFLLLSNWSLQWRKNNFSEKYIFSCSTARWYYKIHNLMFITPNNNDSHISDIWHWSESYLKTIFDLYCHVVRHFDKFAVYVFLWMNLGVWASFFPTTASYIFAVSLDLFASFIKIQERQQDFGCER